jgi:two-component system, OmpR family, sensor histidine kinase VicK
MNYTRPQLAISLDPIRHAFVDAKNRGVRSRYLTEITSENISFCKELLSIVSELRHLDGIKGNFMLSESEYLAPAVLFEKGKAAARIFYSNVKELVEEHEYMFDTLWNKAISAEQRIREIEEGVETIETKVIENKEQIFNHMKSVIGNASERSVCSTIGAMQLVYNNFFEEYKKIIDKHRRDRRGKGIRWITSIIDKDSLGLVKIFLNAGIQLRHVKNLTPMSFAVDNKHFYATIEKMEDGKMIESLLASNEPAYISHYNSIFEELWKNGIDAADRVRDIEAGFDLTYIEVVPSSVKAQEIYRNIVKSAAQEILWIFPTANAFIRQDKIGAIKLAKQVAKERNVKVRILVPENSLIEQKVQKLKEYSPVIDVRCIEQMSETKATILVVDRKASLVMELRDDSKSTFIEAIGLSTYSNSKAGVLSYVAIFENLWIQSDLYEKLKINDKMQKEFINVAAHELRTPIQPILSLSQILQSDKSNNTKQQEFLDAIVRNAKRLQRLTENILDVTRIESHSLELRKERFSLNENIRNVINDMNNQAGLRNTNNKTVSILFDPKQDIFVEADKVRIYEVISNLLKNAIQFTKEGTITIAAAAKKMDYNNEVLVSIKDPGTGIDSEIFPRLFTKFVSKSVAGTGLGLFISKSIVEAHGGRMWAENNKYGNGATFYFSLPLSK